MKLTSELVLKYAREKGWDSLRVAVYGTGGEKDVFRNSHEATAISNFINSRMAMVKDEIISKITLE